MLSELEGMKVIQRDRGVRSLVYIAKADNSKKINVIFYNADDCIFYFFLHGLVSSYNSYLDAAQLTSEYKAIRFCVVSFIIFTISLIITFPSESLILLLDVVSMEFAFSLTIFSFFYLFMH